MYPRNWLDGEQVLSQKMGTTIQKETMKSCSDAEAKTTGGSRSWSYNRA